MTKRSDWSGKRELRSVVQTVRRRWRTRQALRGALYTVGSGLAALFVVGVAVDRLTNPTAATVLAGILYAGVAAIGFFTLLRPLFKRVTDRQVAHYLEEHEPGLRAEILTAVSVLEEENDEESAELLSGLIRSAVLRAREVEGGRRVDRASLKRLSWSTGAMAALLAVVLLSNPLGLRQAVPDLVRPWTAVEAAPTVAIQILPGDTVVARGAELRIAARLQGFDSEGVELAVRGNEEPQWDRWPMVVEDPEGGGDHEFVLFRVDEPLEYYAEADGVRSGTHRIEVVDLPYVGGLDLELHHPAYTGLEPEIIESGGDFVALPGTRVVVRAEPTIPVPAGRIVFEEAGDAALTASTDGVLTGEFTVEESGFYHVELEDESGETHRGTPDHLIDMVEDLPPIVSLEEPARDVRVTSVEEVYVETQATDDYGIGTLELIYSVNGGEEQTLSLMDGGASALQEVSAGHTFFLEEYELQPGDLVSYHVRALDNGPDSEERETLTDLFFIEVRPFSQEFSQAEQGGGGGGGGGGQQADPMAGQFSQRQREIVTATFNVGRDWRQIAPEIVEEDIATITQAQTSLRDEVNAFLDELRRRLARAPEEMQQVAERLPLATEAMEEALGELETGGTEDALPAEQRALQHLLRAEAVFREVQLTQQQGGGGGGGASGAETREDLADFFDLEMDRLRNQYEELQQGERQQQDQQLDQALERLRELARRQEQEEERLQRAAERSQQGAAGAGGESQRRLAEETEELARELERLSREQSSPELAETARQLQDAAEAMRRSAATRDQNGIRQAGDAQAALEEARRLLERDRTNRLNQDAREAADRAQRAFDRQRDIQESVENMPVDAQGRSEALPSILEQKDQLTEDLEQLQEDLNRMAEEAGDGQTEREFREAASAIRDDQLPDRIDFSRNLVGTARPQQAQDFEQQITDLMEELNDQVQAAADAAEGNAQNGGSELAERTRQLVRAAESMEQRAQQAQQQGGQGQDGQPQDGQQQGQGQGQQGQGQGQQGQGQGQQGQGQGQQGQGQQGGTRGGGGNPQGYAGGSFDGNVGRQLRSEASERRAQAEELREELRAAGAPDGSLETLDGVIDRFRNLEEAGIYNEPRALADLQRELVESLRELDFDVRRHFAEGDRDGPVVAGSGEVPEAYREMVEEYFRSLARP